ncbi:Flavin transferase ApbE [Candidatus Nanopelagicaceae bacterium]
MVRKRYEIHVWGTVLFLDVASSTLSEAAIDAAVEDVKKFVYGVDEDFSTYKDGSFVSKLRRGEITIDGCPADVKEVWGLCAAARDLTDGAFDPWAVAGGFDPSGYVKGWAADRVAQILLAAGCEHIQVNAAGDLTLRGGINEKAVVGPWKIGVVNPDNRQEVLRIFEINDGAIATSGTYERGAHIFDPATGTIAIGAKSATVLGPDGGLTDALATALMVSGEDGAVWLGQPELAEYSAWVIDRHSGGAWGVGPAVL